MLRSFLVAVLLVALTACGGLGMDVDSTGTSVVTESSSEESGTTSTSFDLLEGVQEIAIDASGRGVIAFNEVTETDRFVLFMTQYNEAMNSSQVQISTAGAGPAALSKLSDEDLTEDFHENLRNAEVALDIELAQSGASGLAVIKAIEVGETKVFNAINSLSMKSYESVSATLVFQTDQINVYLDNRNASALTHSEMTMIFSNFSNIIDEERNLFGHESDINGDGRFDILLSQSINAIGAAGGGVVTGFFYAGDLMSQAVLPASNEQEIIYALVPDPSGEFGWPVPTDFYLSNLLPSVLPHEFQHMISYNEHVLVNAGPAESAFLNEGLSHLAEDIYSLNSQGFMEKTGIENPARVQGYLRQTSDLCFYCGASLYQRGGTYLFLRYLYEQAEVGNLPAVGNGRALLKAMTRTPLTGMDNIADAALDGTDLVGTDLAETDLAETDEIASLLKLYGLAVYLSGTGLTTDSHYNFSGLALRNAQNDKRGTMLQGPAEINMTTLPHTDSLSSAGLGYYLIEGSTLTAAGSTLEIQVENNAQTKATLLRF